MKNYNAFFETELKRMNDAQKQAVESTEGPVMVIAGPGTGKTQILAARIGYILQNSDLQTFPENILCLTYTEAGAIAMRQRLISFIGTEANKISILTFHSFCNQLIQQYSDYFGHDDLRMITPIEELLLIREIIDKLEKNNPLKRYTGDVYYEAKRLLSLFKQMKKEDWSSQFIETKIEDYLKEIVEKPEQYPQFYYTRKYKDKNKGDIKDKAFELEQEKMEKLKAASLLSEKYMQLMAQKKLYDFDDMILWVLKELKTNETFKSQLQERFTYILVDEFQDTNESQNEVVSELCSHWGIDSNIFVVGDDDQSIYRFQGANIQNIISFKHIYESNLKTILLKENYRSNQSILDASASLINRNNERIINQFQGMDKNLLAVNNSSSDRVVVTELPNQADEIIYIVNQIKKDIENGIPAKDIAVIYRNNKQAEELAKYLDYSKIPFSLRKRLNILKEPFTKKLIYLLKYIINENDKPYSEDDKLFRLLQFDFWQLKDINEPAKLLLAYNIENHGKKEDRIPFRKYIQQLNANNKADLFSSNQTQVQHIVTLLDSLIQDVNNHSSQEFFEHFINKVGLIPYLLKNTDKTFLLEQLRSLFDTIIRESERNKHMQIEQILEQLHLMQQLDLPIEIERIIYRGEGVSLTTAHSSKGLEFHSVYMLGNTHKEWSSGNNYGFSLPLNLFQRIGVLDENEEQRRLFYVAMTRAKQKLYITYHTENFDGKKQEPCIFIHELIENTKDVVVFKEKIDEADAVDFQMVVMQPIELKELPEMHNPIVKKFMDNLSISATQMSSYLECPRQFYYNYVLKVPAAKQKALVFGNAVHAAYENLFKKLKENNNEFLPVEYMLSVFKARMYQDEGAFSDADFKRYIEHGENIITNHYNYYIQSWNKIVTAERRMRAVVYGGIPITGFIDKIEFDGNKAFVVDYKTGKPSNALDKFKKPQTVADKSIAKKHELYGGDYWRQAVFYKILLEHDSIKANSWIFAGAEFDFIEPDAKTGVYIKEQIIIEKEDEEFVSSLIKEVYTKIKNYEFDQGCGECEWCDMLK